MSLLLTGHVDQYRIDVAVGRTAGRRPYRLGAARFEPLADQLAVKIIMLSNQYAFHGALVP
jgi:hypothetical protein